MYLKISTFFLSVAIYYYSFEHGISSKIEHGLFTCPNQTQPEDVLEILKQQMV